MKIGINMTMSKNKMPKVGERYKCSDQNCDWLEFINFELFELSEDKGKITYCVFQRHFSEYIGSKHGSGAGMVHYSLEYFWENFESVADQIISESTREKLPEVGREYRCKNLPDNCVYYIYKVHLIERREGDPGFRIQLITNIGNWLDRVSPAKFWEEYEEIPSTNQQEKSNKFILDDSKTITLPNINWIEVEKAKEELKEKLNDFRLSCLFGSVGYAKDLKARAVTRNFKDAAQNLLDALESKENQMKNSDATGIFDKNNHEIYVRDFVRWGIHEGIVSRYEDGFIFADGLGLINLMTPKIEIIVDPYKARWNNEKEEKSNCGISINIIGHPNEVTKDYMDRNIFNKDQVEEEKRSEEESVAEKIDFTGYRSTRTAQEALDEQLRFINAMENLKNPKSIWKDVKELPEQNCHVIIQDYSDRYSVFECAEKRLTNISTGIYAREDKIVKKFCTLTDFINAFEDLQERVRKLEEK